MATPDESGRLVPMERTMTRRLPEDYRGPVLFCDIDQTYLQTPIQSLRKLIRVPFEKADEKKTVPGVPALLRALRRGLSGGAEPNPLFFVSASPPFLRKVLEEKLALDQIGFDGLTLKDQWSHIKRARFRKLTEQIGYKLAALLAYRRELPRGSEEVLIGDDMESDTEIYDTYRRIVAGTLRGAGLVSEVRSLGVDGRDAKAIRLLADEIAPRDSVRAIFIRRSVPAPDVLPPYAPKRPFLCRSAFQMALGAYATNLIRPEDVLPVALAYRTVSRVAPAYLLAELMDGVERNLLTGAEAKALVSPLREAGLIPSTSL